MNKSELHTKYRMSRTQIVQKIAEFNSIPEENYFHELVFCLLTPASNARRCWNAVQEIRQLETISASTIHPILRKHTRFHNQKTLRVMAAYYHWPVIKAQLDNKDRIELRNWLAANVRGLGLKESAHFLRNIGRSNNQIAILDRHILRNLKSLRVISEDSVRSPKNYLDIEQRFIAFSKKVGIPIDYLDLLFWSTETGEIFK